mmetsp:Transcript_86682/g.144144  ORF Transcript_86682/g.144144 Transcript_86682/m.144144 type:complete len:116 (-) Transcript_86682:396-743(-)
MKWADTYLRSCAWDTNEDTQRQKNGSQQHCSNDSSERQNTNKLKTPQYRCHQLVHHGRCISGERASNSNQHVCCTASCLSALQNTGQECNEAKHNTNPQECGGPQADCVSPAEDT